MFLCAKLVLLAGLLAWGGWGHWKADRIGRQWETEKTGQALAYIRDSEKIRADHAAQLAQREGAIHVAAKEIEAARTRTAAERVVVGSLRDILAATANRAKAGDTSALAAGAAVDRLTGVARECVERLEALAGRTRESLVAHRQCVAEYEVMRQR